MKRITSRSNPLFKSLLKLKDSRHERRAVQGALLDGPHLVAAYLDRVGAPQVIALAEGAQHDAEIAALLARAGGIEPLILSGSLFRELAPVKTPTGILAVAPVPEARPVSTDAHACLLLEAIQDPGNLGTILRTAAAAGISDVLLSRDCADAWSPRVLRAAMGAHFALNVVERADLLPFARAYSGQVVATAARGGRPVYDTDLTPPTAFAVGNEGAGVSVVLAGAADFTISIPMPGAMESINVAAAVAICLFERTRQLAKNQR